MEASRSHTVSNNFQNSLVAALEHLRLTVSSEFETALQEACVVPAPVGDGKAAVHPRKVSWFIPQAPLAESQASEPVRRARPPPVLGLPKDVELETSPGLEESIDSHSLADTSVVGQGKHLVGDVFFASESTKNDSMSSIVLCVEGVELADLMNKKKTKTVTVDRLPIIKDVWRDRASSASSAKSDIRSMHRSDSPMQQSSSWAQSSQASSTTRVGEIEQDFLRISNFWMKLFDAGLHTTCLASIGDDARIVESTALDMLKMATSAQTAETRKGVNTEFLDYDYRQIATMAMDRMHMESKYRMLSKYLQPFVLPPDSKVRIFWSFLSLMFLAYDFVTIPVEECFPSAENKGFINILQWVIQFFWSLDIPMSFLTAYTNDGFLETNPVAIGKKYLKTWFFFDLSLVSLEWVLLSVNNLGAGSLFSLLRNFRAFRIIRMVRLLRFARLWKMIPFMRRSLMVSSQGFGATLLLFSVVFACFIFAHIGACVWHLIGDTINGGWVSANSMGDYSVSRRYSVSLHYMFIRLQGSSSNLIFFDEPLEIVIDTFLLFVSLLMTCVLLSVVAHALVIWIQSDAAQVKKLADLFLKRHHIQPDTTKRIRNFLQANQMHGPGEMLVGEGKFLKALPTNLQEELFFESRRQVLCINSVFSLILLFSSRCVRAMCQNAFRDLLAVEGEIVFHKGDENLGEVYFLRLGKLWYMCDEEILKETWRPSHFPREATRRGCDMLRRGVVISEVALFVNHWQHMGDLIPQQDSILLVLQVSKFTEIIQSYRIASTCALKYARHYVWSLNHSVHCDLSGFTFTVEKLDEELVSGTAEDHFAFISHYKMEAGTEATLLRDLMEQKIREDPSNDAVDFISPVFVDSEDLVDLARLEQHVIGSSNLVLLLTPGILTRPWCLLEIVVAHHNGVQLVPVEIQRPGMKYHYPNDEWYEQFLNGKILGPADEQILQKEGHSLQSVADAVRQLFKKISLPFSPHKSGNVRKAEIEDIMKRCCVDGVQVIPSASDPRASNKTLSESSSPRSRRRTQAANRVSSRKQ